MQISQNYEVTGGWPDVMPNTDEGCAELAGFHGKHCLLSTTDLARQARQHSDQHRDIAQRRASKVISDVKPEYSQNARSLLVLQ